MTDKRENACNTLRHWHNFRLQLLMEGVAIGLISGAVVVAYRFSLEKAMHMASYMRRLVQENPGVVPLYLGGIVLLGVLIGWIVRLEPMVKGSGIPQVEGILLRNMKIDWFRVILGKFIGGVLALGGGLSLGREGPSVQIGASIGQGFGKIFKRMKLEEKYLVTSGASAGLAAAFNAPLAGVMFALEEVHKNFSPLILLPAMAASVAADFVSRKFFGQQPVFDFRIIELFPLDHYFHLIFLGVILGIFGVLFNKVMIKTQHAYARQNIIKSEFNVIIPLIFAGTAGFLMPQILGGGHGLIVSLMEGGLTIKMLFAILICKFAFTMLSYGSGAPGGIFLPLLVIGALTGDIYGNVMAQMGIIETGYIKNLIILSMAGYFTAIVRAPITGIILVSEMTGSFRLLLPVTIIAIAAHVTADLMGSEPIYESLLDGILQKNPEKVEPESDKKTIIQVIVCLGSNIEGKRIKEVNWPANFLVVGIKRGMSEIIPEGDTQILAGDYITALVDEENAEEIERKLIQNTRNAIVNEAR
ncbi:H+/Cl-antiporter ClcA [Peptoclostridium litorale DSM 5388]|uniref:H(+)/Cl(-) exchange transporter ClcA n=1 Tax=Peptoclostridium litorale DSM 5388 TaxID=1121324 RepID=A0A069RJ41_PEPLI|nr:H(+)/Cl(-) exchange transporter ClcA [Peptoclostridium litorale]KDR96135.1 H(+)/Cl(-) exchange transporter ClcA [Peptoclostridium litorale DSM 5388]SIO03874.1 H+/Cl-antiporter ClcA [Peptoclostridium litorale DSM 5388]